MIPFIAILSKTPMLISRARDGRGSSKHQKRINLNRFDLYQLTRDNCKMFVIIPNIPRLHLHWLVEDSNYLLIELEAGKAPCQSEDVDCT